MAELDPLFVKALKLMQSRSKDATEQLKAMLDEAIAQRRASKKEKTASGESERSSSGSHKHTKQEEERKRDTEKRHIDKLKSEISELSESKRPKLDPPPKEEKKESPEKKEKKEKDGKKAEKSEKVEVKKEATSDSEDKNMDADDFAFDLGISCSVCRSFEVSSGNQLVECLECHNLYHQECHKPSITEREVNDPRCVWYCSHCSKSLKKMQVAKPPKAKVALGSSSGKDSDSSSGKASKSPTPTTNPFQFRRSEPKLSSGKDSNNGGVAKPMSGFESLAANLSGKNLLDAPTAKAKIEQLKQMTWSKDGSKSSSKHESSSSGSKCDTSLSRNTSKSSSSSSSSSSSKGANWSGSVAMAAINAEKKLQFVKKRAAMKITDKKHYK